VPRDSWGRFGDYGGDQLTSSVSHYSSFIAECMNTLHARIPLDAAPDLDKPAHVEFREEWFQGDSVRRAVVFLLTNGCEWALKSGHGCTMCGHLAKQTRTHEPISADHFVGQFRTALKTIDSNGVPILNIFNNGSFFNEHEIPVEARRAILSMINGSPSIRRLVVECRPEYITEPVVREARTILPDKELEIAIGLESSDDRVRRLAINKGFSLREFAEAARVIKDAGVKLKAYVLLKPPFLSEREAIEDAVQTISTAFSLGVDTVSIEAVTVQRYTLVEFLTEHSMYRVPWLWSVLEVVKRTAHLGRVIVGLFQFYPSPQLVPHNCEQCNERVMSAIVEYDRTLNVEVLRGLDCACMPEWAARLEAEACFEENLQRFVATATAERLVQAGARAAQDGETLSSWTDQK
jgi:archaeosine synthase beta-subunit